MYQEASVFRETDKDINGIYSLVQQAQAHKTSIS